MRTSKTFIRSQKIEQILCKTHAYLGESRSRPGLDRYGEIYRQGFTIIDTQIPILQLDRAYHFLKIAAGRGEKICFLGDPSHKGKGNEGVFFPNPKTNHKKKIKRRVNYYHFSSDQWTPGLFTQRSRGKSSKLGSVSIVVIFDLEKDQAAKEEAVRTQKIIIGFGRSSKDFEGVDYPIPLSLLTARGGIFYRAFLKTLFQIPSTPQTSLKQKREGEREIKDRGKSLKVRSSKEKRIKKRFTNFNNKKEIKYKKEDRSLSSNRGRKERAVDLHS